MFHIIRLLQLRNGEYITFMTQFENLINLKFGATAKPAPLAQKLTVYQTVLAQLNALFINDPASALTDDLAALDADRDRSITGLVKMCDAYTYHPNPLYREYGATLLHSLQIYGAGIAEQGYNAESASIVNIVTDWNTKADIMEAKAALGLGDWADAMANTNSAFNSMFMQRNTETTAADLPYTMKDKRVEMNTAYNDVLRKLETYDDLNEGAAPYGPIVAEGNNLIDYYIDLLKTRAGRMDGDDDGTPPPPQNFPGS